MRSLLPGTCLFRRPDRAEMAVTKIIISRMHCGGFCHEHCVLLNSYFWIQARAQLSIEDFGDIALRATILFDRAAALFLPIRHDPQTANGAFTADIIAGLCSLVQLSHNIGKGKEIDPVVFKVGWPMLE